MSSPNKLLLTTLADAPAGSGSGGGGGEDDISVDLSELWFQFCAGTKRVAASPRGTPDAFYLITQRIRAPTALNVPTQGEVAILQSLLLGASIDGIAIDRSQARSTVAGAATRILTKFGISPPNARLTPMVIVVAAHAAERVTNITHGRERRVVRAGDDLSAVFVSRFDNSVQRRVSPAIYAVVRDVLAGSTSRQIAQQRGNSVSTVARQFARACNDYSARDRLELASKLIRVAERANGCPTPV